METYKEDPHGIVPVGWENPGQYKVVCFPAPAGASVLSLMVGVQYPNYVENGWGYSTTLDYITILRDYMARCDCMALFKAQDAWRQKKIAQFEATGNDDEIIVPSEP